MEKSSWIPNIGGGNGCVCGYFVINVSSLRSVPNSEKVVLGQWQGLSQVKDLEGPAGHRAAYPNLARLWPTHVRGGCSPPSRVGTEFPSSVSLSFFSKSVSLFLSCM